MKLGIHQPNFFPWLGYFYKIQQVDLFVFLDDAQLIKTGGSYTNRVEILNNGKRQTLTVPIKRISGTQEIKDVKEVNEIWRIKMLKSMQMSYSKTPFFSKEFSFIEQLFEYSTSYISDFNQNAIVELCKHLRIDTPFELASDLNIGKHATERLIAIVKHLGGGVYLSGKGGQKYQEEDAFREADIELEYTNFVHPIYEQRKVDEFVTGLSILDALFHLGNKQVSEILLKNKT